MIERTVEEIYLRNASIREELKQTVDSISGTDVYRIPEGEKWSVANIIEHLTLVEAGAMRICTKLLSKAREKGRIGDGKIRISNNFIEKGAEMDELKVEAPEIVQPTGGLSIGESYVRFDEQGSKLKELRTMFEAFDANEDKFPHPYFGGLTSGEWLFLIGAHEARHLKQIKAMLKRM